ncbi:MAG: DUF1844 domain-containing protein [Deltaproteobacteria bacterium]|nr:DUF1844 domain-containing protein [Deltaproteobacteria bacterium]MBF0524331.1 DUF1844 domain-containing protein [Deltaproteobacteria bacterium]
MTQEEKGFTVKDRRIFSPSPDEPSPVEQGAPESVTRPAPEPQASRPEKKAETPPPRTEEENVSLPSPSLAQLVISLSTTTFISLGQMPDLNSGKMERDLELAKYNIDLLAMLKEKTKGNLTAEEDKLLDGLLYELRIKYVQAAAVK